MSEKDINAIKLELQSTDKSVLKNAIKKIGNLGIHLFETDVLNIYLSIQDDSNEWELQSIAIKALGRLQCKFILPIIEIIIKENSPRSIITIAAASAYVRIKRESREDAQPIIKLLKCGDIAVSSGALKVLWEDKITPSLDEIDNIIRIVQYDRKDFFEKNIAIDPRQDLLNAISIWGVKDVMIQDFIDYCSTIHSLQNDDVVREYSTKKSKLDKLLYKIESDFEENDTPEMTKKVLLCMDDLGELINSNDYNMKNKLDYYKGQFKIDDWYKYCILTSFVKDLLDSGYSKDTIEKIIYDSRF